LVELFLSDQMRRKATTRSVPLTRPSWGGASAGRRSIRGAPLAASVMAS
jgi:hypothetical protein